MKAGFRGSLLLLIVVFVAASLGAEKRPMTPLDVVHLRAARNAQLSPDGQWVVFELSVLNWEKGKRYSDIYVSSVATGAQRRMTFTDEASEQNPRWARDSIHFAFLSNRADGKEKQLYLMRRDGGEARIVQGHKGPVADFAFSRDGRWLAYRAGKQDEEQLWLVALDAAEAQATQLTQHSTPVRRWVWTEASDRIYFSAPERVDKDDQKRKEKKFDVAIRNPERIAAHLWSIDLATKQEQRWTQGEFSVGSIVVSRDARKVALRSRSLDRYVSDVEAAGTYGEIYLLDVASGRLEQLTNNQVGESQPSFSPDSRWIAFSSWEDFETYRRRRVYLRAVDGGDWHVLPKDWPYDASIDSWSPDSKTIYFIGGVGVGRHLFALGVPDGRLQQITNEEGAVLGGLDRDSGLFLLGFTDSQQPADYYVVEPARLADRAAWQRVSNANPQVAELALGSYETIRWRSTDGVEVEGLLIKPVGYEEGKRYPLIVQIHGGPAGAYVHAFPGRWSNYAHVYAGAGYAVFQPNYRGSSNYGDEFRRQIAGDYFRQGYEDIISGVDYLIARGVADPEKLGMMGWSAGGHWSNWTLVSTDRFKAISSGAGGMNWISMYAQTDIQFIREFYFRGTPYEHWDHYVEVSPLRYIKNAKTPTLIHVGHDDARVPRPQSEELHMALKKLGVPTEFIVYPRMPHGLREPRYQLVKMVSEFNWFEKWLRGKEGWFEWKELLATLPGEEKKEEKAATSNQP
ncbi:MAG: prolyl oligopeptidase family serine peptidase [Terriglobia bacterium]